MKKDAYYFSHDSNSKDDPKCMLLIDQLGLEGYGIFWVLVEILRDQPEYKYPLNLLPIIARRYNTTAEKMNAVVSKYGLFDVDQENNFFSISLIERMQKLEIIREKRKLAGLKSGESRKLKALKQKFNTCSAEVQHVQNKNEQSKVKESKVKESKVKKSKVNNNKEKEVLEIIEYLNVSLKTNYRSSTKKTKDFIVARLNEGFKVADFKVVIDKKRKEWANTDMQKFLRPQTLFGNNFESYLNQKDEKIKGKGATHEYESLNRKYTNIDENTVWEEER